MPKEKFLSSETIDIYWQEIKKFNTLTRDQEFELFDKLRSGNGDAEALLIKSNLRFVIRIAREYIDRGLSMADLVSEGNFGLIEAMRRFDHTRGFKFITYAVWWIRQAIKKALCEKKSIARLPTNQIMDSYKIEKQSVKMAQNLGRPPSEAELADSTEMGVNRAHAALIANHRDVSLDQPINGHVNPIIESLSSDETSVDEIIFQQQLNEAINRCFIILNQRELYILKHYFGFNDRKTMTLEQIGNKLKLTRERVRQIKEDALNKIRVDYGKHLSLFH